MYVIATFEQTIFLELALSALEQKDVLREQILAVPLDKRSTHRPIFDSIHYADGFSLVDLAAVLGTVFMLLGTIYGYVLRWGPIIWGIIGGVFGVLLGFGIKYVYLRKRLGKYKAETRKIASELVVMIHCDERKWETVEKILWENHALGVARMKQKERTETPG
jgi:hypothetical protein